MKNSDNSSSMR